ncbi:hypothetical protein F5Y11DRAFT_249527 [Daldinia sp. FL1419]|nr:hypothetical protein F5Y11DRAFT_249527 [Daldinia sp. FL1419]
MVEATTKGLLGLFSLLVSFLFIKLQLKDNDPKRRGDTLRWSMTLCPYALMPLCPYSAATTAAVDSPAYAHIQTQRWSINKVFLPTQLISGLKRWDLAGQVEKGAKRIGFFGDYVSGIY